MRIGLLVDLTFDLPRRYTHENGIKVSRCVSARLRQAPRQAGLERRFALALINRRNIFSSTVVGFSQRGRMIKSGAWPSTIDSKRRDRVSHG